MSANIISQFQCSTFGHDYPTLQFGLFAVAELLVNFDFIAGFLLNMWCTFFYKTCAWKSWNRKVVKTIYSENNFLSKFVSQKTWAFDNKLIISRYLLNCLSLFLAVSCAGQSSCPTQLPNATPLSYLDLLCWIQCCDDSVASLHFDDCCLQSSLLSPTVVFVIHVSTFHCRYSI